VTRIPEPGRSECPRCSKHHATQRRVDRCRELQNEPAPPVYGRGRGIRAIPTEYAGARFRSRLEAKWAAFFDLLGWRWEYEPIDLDGYIPDFILTGFPKPILVEVKPRISRDELVTAASGKIEASGWAHDALIVGLALLPYTEGVGVLSQRSNAVEVYPDDWSWADGIVACNPEGDSRPCRPWGLIHTEGAFTCYRCGSYAGGHWTEHPDIVAVWRAAGNAVQWRGRERAL